MTNYGLDLALIGNGRTAALLEPGSRIVWWCFPRFDSDPVLCRLLAGDEEKGFTDVVVEGLKDVKSEYLRNTPIVVTELTDEKGGVVRITDFAPRFHNLDRIYRAPQLVRIIEPVSGLPRITIRFRPTNNYGHPIRERTLGSNHIRYWEADTQIRLSTDAPLSYIEREVLVRADAADAYGARRRRAVSRGARHHLPRLPRTHPRLLARMGAPAQSFL